ncbi:MAG: hypothetical protein GWP09_02605 [Nitrospiraceae bacterium]|nr:hypothetical protein [Nitrospiraceae bacterium]
MKKKRFNIHTLLNRNSLEKFLDDTVKTLYDTDFTIDNIVSELYKRNLDSPMHSAENLYLKGLSMTYQDREGKTVNKLPVVSYIELKTAFDIISKAYLGRMSREKPKSDEQIVHALKLKYKISYATFILSENYDFLDRKEKKSIEQEYYNLKRILVADGFGEDVESLEQEVNTKLSSFNQENHLKTTTNHGTYFNKIGFNKRPGSIRIPYLFSRVHRKY